MSQENKRKIPAPLRPDQLPSSYRNCDPNEGDENGPFIVTNKTGDVLDRRNYCRWIAPEYGDGYSDFRSDYDFSPEYLAEKEASYQQGMALMPDEFKQRFADRKAELEKQRQKE